MSRFISHLFFQTLKVIFFLSLLFLKNAIYPVKEIVSEEAEEPETEPEPKPEPSKKTKKATKTKKGKTNKKKSS